MHKCYIIFCILILSSLVNAQQKELVEQLSLCTYAGKSYIFTKGVTITATSTCSFTFTAQPGVPFFIRPAAASLVAKNTSSSLDKNFVREENIMITGVSDENQIPGLLEHEKSVQFEYIDGLGRLNESVNVKASPLKNDVVLANYFDNVGHKVKEYLPYTNPQKNGGYRSAYDAESKSFYSATPKVAFEDTRPYKEHTYENSSLDRIIDTYEAGKEWRTANRRNQAYVKVEINPTIKKWLYVDDNTPPTIGSYDTISVNVLIDEENQVSREFTNKRGQTILKQNLESGDYLAAPGSVTWLDTYFIYDDLGLLKIVMPPEAVSRIATEYITDNDTKNLFLQRWCTQYRYDAVQNMTKRWLPGWTDWEYSVYDKWNRKALIQTPAQRQRNEWSFTKFDQHNRIIMTGLWVTPTTYANIVLDATASANRYETVPSTSTPEGYTLTSTYPTAIGASDLITITYFDNYSFLNFPNWDTEGPSSNYSVVSIPGLPDASEFLTIPSGQETGKKTKVLGSNKWLNSVTRYDKKCQPIQVIAENNIGGRDRLTTKYSFSGKVLSTQAYHTSTSLTLTIFREYVYDHANRLTQLYQTTDNGARVLMKSDVYNDLGQLVEKNIHSTDNGLTFLQSVDYRYNIRGWLTSLNNSTLTNDGTLNDDNNDIFGLEALYNPVAPPVINKDPSGTFTTTKIYDGKISAIKWKVDDKVNTPIENIYSFQYDNIDRLTKAYFASKNAGNWNSNVGLFDEQIASYDKNGNINRILRNGKVDGVKANIDDLTLTYDLNGKRSNRLVKVEDATSNKAGYTNVATGMTEELTFDKSGNLNFDANKQISKIDYNHLNLPTEIQFTRPGGAVDRIQYTYDANGTKLTSNVYKNGTSSANGTLVWTTGYVGDIQFDNGVLTFAKTPEGRVLKNISGFDYEYFYKDRHGNVRATYGLLNATVSYRATMENPPASTLGQQEQATFANISSTRYTDPVFNYTTSSTDILTPSNSSQTNGFLNKPIGPAKMLTLSAGDRVKMEVFAKYSQTTGNAATITAAALVSAVTTSFGITSGEAIYAGFNANVPIIPGIGSASTTLPKAYLSYLFFDNNDAFITSAAVPVSSSAFNAFEKLERTFTATQNGKLYIYVTNETKVSNAISVYFDEMQIVHQKNNKNLQVTQTSDYYPFGLPFNAFQAKRIKDDYSYVQNNRYGFQGQETQRDLDLGWSEFKYRMHDPSIGRFNAVDPLATDFPYNSPYAFQENKLGSGTELEGQELQVWAGIEVAKFLYSISPLATAERTAYAMRGYAANEINYATTRGEQYQQALQNNKTSINSIDAAYRLKDLQAKAELIDAGMELWALSVGGGTGALENIATNTLIKQTIKSGMPGLSKAISKSNTTAAKEFSLLNPLAEDAVSGAGYKTLSELGLLDGMKVSPSEALDLGQQFLGKGYKEVISENGIYGRYISADGKRAFRMGTNDITGAHGGGPHVNFETLVPNPNKPGKMMVDQNFHIYLTD